MNLMDEDKGFILPKQTLSSVLLESILSLSAFYLLFRCVVHSVSSPDFLSRWQISRGVALDIANKTVSAFFATLATSTGLYILLTFDSQSSFSGALSAHKSISHILPAAMGYFLYDVLAMYEVFAGGKADQKEATFADFVRSHPLMAAHHLMLSLFFIPLMVNRRDHDPGDAMLACALVMEASTPFVSMRAVLHHLHQRKSWLYVANGLAMVAVFFLCRIAIYPWFYHVYGVSRGMSSWEAVKATPPTCAIWMVLVLVLQLYWFGIMASGAAKVMRERIENAKQG